MKSIIEENTKKWNNCEDKIYTTPYNSLIHCEDSVRSSILFDIYNHTNNCYLRKNRPYSNEE